MQFIKKFKTLFIRDKIKQEKFNKSKEQTEIITNPKIKTNITNHRKNENELLCYASFGKLKVYRRPVLKEDKEREQLINQISKELEKLS